MVISKIKRAHHVKHKKSYQAGSRARQPVIPKRKTPQVGDKTQQNEFEHKNKSKGKTGLVLTIQSFGKQKKTKEVKERKEKKITQHKFGASEMLDMMDEEDLQFFKDQTIPNDISSSKRKREEPAEDAVEEDYNRKLLMEGLAKKKIRHLLPIKTKQGIVERTVEVEHCSSDEEEKEKEPAKEEQEDTPESIAEIYARRKQKLEDLKGLIGSSSSNILENPDERMDHISAVLKLYKQLTPDILITGFKLISVSLVELFKDLAPGFEIKATHKPGDRLKKATREIYGNEARLLKYYQMFLKKLEDTFTPLRKAKKRDKSIDECSMRNGLFALKCMCDLLVSMPHFNFAKNIVHSLIPFTALKLDEARLIVCSAFKNLFKDDKHGEISLHAVRQVNHLIKTKRHYQIPPDCLDMLITLRIKDVNLDREKEEEINRYKTMTRKEKILIMSKNERRRRKKIERLEREVVEAKAEHNKGSKSKYQTETVKLVFTIYFRILKMAPDSGLMGVVLQGLAKYIFYILKFERFFTFYIFKGLHIQST